MAADENRELHTDASCLTYWLSSRCLSKKGNHTAAVNSNNFSYQIAPSDPGDTPNYFESMSMCISTITLPRRSRIAVVCTVESVVDFADTITFMDGKNGIVPTVQFHLPFYDSMFSTWLGILHILSISVSVFELLGDINEIWECRQPEG